MTTIEEHVEEVGACPVCGAVSGTTLSQAPALLAVCDVLVVKTLERVGKALARGDKRRFAQLDPRPFHIAHTIWPVRAHDIDKYLIGAWDVIPAMLSNHGCCGVTAVQVSGMVDGYVRDLLVTGTPHALGELRYRMSRFLGIDLPASAPYDPTLWREG
jgi:hypothetical protein